MRNALIQVVAAGERAGAVVSGVRAMFRKEPTEHTQIDINTLIRTMLEIVRVELLRNEVTLDLKRDEVPSTDLGVSRGGERFDFSIRIADPRRSALKHFSYLPVA